MTTTRNRPIHREGNWQMMPKLNNSILEPATIRVAAIAGVGEWRRCALGILLGVTTTGLTGCTILGGLQKKIQHCDCVDDFMISHRNQVMATRAWLRIKHNYHGHCYLKDFRNGFIAGYIDVANGGAGCTPTVVSSKYWGWRYQSGTGQAAVNAWYEGFPLGAKAAEEDGIGNYNMIQLNGSPQATTNMNGSASPTPAATPVLQSPNNDFPPGVILEDGETLMPGGFSIQDRGAGAVNPQRALTTPEFVPAPVEMPDEEMPDDAAPPARPELNHKFDTGEPADVKVEPYLNDLGDQSPSGKSAETKSTYQETQLWNEISGESNYSRSSSPEANSAARNEGLDLVPRDTKPISTPVSTSISSLIKNSPSPGVSSREVKEPSQAEVDAVIEEIFGKPPGASR